jgi:hypothetical protein
MCSWLRRCHSCSTAAPAILQRASEPIFQTLTALLRRPPAHTCCPLQCVVSAQQYHVPSLAQLAYPGQVALHETSLLQSGVGGACFGPGHFMGRGAGPGTSA